MKHVWWGTIVLVAVCIGAWVTLIVTGHPLQARDVLVNGLAPTLVVGVVLLGIGVFAGALDD